MKTFLIVSGVVATGVAGVYYFLHRRPEPRWQVGSILAGEDPDTGWEQYVVNAVEWRERSYLDITKTEYKPQWWYRINNIKYTGAFAGNWYPEEFLLSAARG